MHHALKARIVFPGGTKFGAGRAELLRNVDAHGSLNRAVKAMGMSYRAAWGYLQELEAAAGFAFVERETGAGTHLTDRGRAFLDAFDVFRARLDACATTAFAESFPGAGTPEPPGEV